MDRNQLLFVLTVGFSTLVTIKVLEYYKINDSFVTFTAIVLVGFAVANIWKNVRI